MNNRNQRDSRRATFGLKYSSKVINRNIVTIIYDFSNLAKRLREAERALQNFAAAFRSKES